MEEEDDYILNMMFAVLSNEVVLETNGDANSLVSLMEQLKVHKTEVRLWNIRKAFNAGNRRWEVSLQRALENPNSMFSLTLSHCSDSPTVKVRMEKVVAQEKHNNAMCPVINIYELILPFGEGESLKSVLWRTFLAVAQVVLEEDEAFQRANAKIGVCIPTLCTTNGNFPAQRMSLCFKILTSLVDSENFYADLLYVALQDRAPTYLPR